ncbi:hypothetical protein [Azonexus hydrophilus]|uniref:Uncharacterized protein n=1 Tax=Azonexus hydrophilus TaxID=418702 RepID=A0ABZ2XEN9_9RHOO
MNEIEQKKAQLEQRFEQTIAFHPALARVGGSAAAGLFLSQLIYWSGKGKHPEGWIYKDAAEWEQETCLTRAEQRTARSALTGRGLIEESDMRKLEIDLFKNTLTFRVRWDKLAAALDADDAKEKEKREKKEKCKDKKAA